MSKKNRAQHNVPRRHGDRNVQTRYSRKLQQEECGCGRTCHEGVRGAGFTFIPEVKVSIKIGELHLHGDEHMETFNFHNGCLATVMHGAGSDAEVETDFEEEEIHGEEE